MSRARIAAAVVMVVALGLASRRFPLGVSVWDKSLGDALYAVMVYLLVALVRPGALPARLGIAAFVISFAIELFQLTGIPAAAPRLVRIALGTTFAWHDVACYAIGAVVTACVHHAWTRIRPAAA